MSGGIGEEERETLNQLDQSYALQLIFADTTGYYLSAVTVVITDEQGHQVRAAVSHGPWFFANLPAGRYHIRATTLGDTRAQVIQVFPGRRVRLAFSWTEQGIHLAQGERFSPAVCRRISFVFNCAAFVVPPLFFLWSS